MSAEFVYVCAESSSIVAQVLDVLKLIREVGPTTKDLWQSQLERLQKMEVLQIDRLDYSTKRQIFNESYRVFVQNFTFVRCIRCRLACGRLCNMVSTQSQQVSDLSPSSRFMYWFVVYTMIDMDYSHCFIDIYFPLQGLQWLYEWPLFGKAEMSEMCP